MCNLPLWLFFPVGLAVGGVGVVDATLIGIKIEVGGGAVSFFIFFTIIIGWHGPIGGWTVDG